MTMSGVNKVMLLGRVSGIPQFRQFEETPRMAFALVTTETLQKHGEPYEHEERHEIVLQGCQAEQGLTTIRDGDFLVIEGSLITAAYTDEEDVRRYRTYIRACHFETLILAV